jgi:hypothetical protein
MPDPQDRLAIPRREGESGRKEMLVYALNLPEQTQIEVAINMDGFCPFSVD